MSQMLGQTWEDEMLERGMERGRIAGALSTLRDVLRALLTQRFGALPDAVVQRIEQTEDADRLNACVLNLHQMSSLDDLRWNDRD